MEEKSGDKLVRLANLIVLEELARKCDEASKLLRLELWKLEQDKREGR